MDAEEIALMVRDLKLAKETEGGGIMITKEEEKRGNERLAKTVVGRIFARRQVNKETLKTHLPRILRVRGGLEMEIVGHNLFAISFTLASDKRTAMEEGPWHFFQDLMIFKETNPMQSVAEVEFNDIMMWIQCHNVPMACMETEILERIGSKVGIVQEIDQDEGGIGLGKTIRMRVSRKLDAPLIRYVPVNTEDKETDAIVIIQYEKLPHFCFACGRIGHILKDCEDETVDKKKLRYDNRLRVGGSLSGQAYSGRGGGMASRGGYGREKVGLLKGGEREQEDREEDKEERSGSFVGRELAEVGKGSFGEDDNLGLEVVDEENLKLDVVIGGGLSVDVMEEELGEVERVLEVADRDQIDREVARIAGGGDVGKEGEGSKKRGGKAWKRIARGRKEKMEAEGVGGAVASPGSVGSKKRGLEDVEENQPPQKRLERSELNVNLFNPTAEAVAQPRRQQ